MYRKNRYTRKGGGPEVPAFLKALYNKITGPKNLRTRLRNPKFTINQEKYFDLVYHMKEKDPDARRLLQNYAARRGANIPTVKLSDYQSEFTDIILPSEILDISVTDKSYKHENLIDKYSAQQSNVTAKLSSSILYEGVFSKYGNAIISNYIAKSVSEDICALSSDDKLFIFQIMNDMDEENYALISEDDYDRFATRCESLGYNTIRQGYKDAVLHDLLKNDAKRERLSLLFNECTAPLFSLVVSLNAFLMSDPDIQKHRQMIVVNKDTKEIYISDSGMGKYASEYYVTVQNYINSLAGSTEYYITNDTIECPASLQNKTDDNLCTVWVHLILHLWLLNKGRSFSDIANLLYTKSESALRVLINAYTVFLGNIFSQREGILREIGEFGPNVPAANILGTLKGRRRRTNGAHRTNRKTRRRLH